MEHLGCKATQAVGDCNQRAWNGGGSCTKGGFACIACTSPGFEATRNFLETPKIAGIPIGLPLDMPKAWFVALAALSKSATPRTRAQECDGRSRRRAAARRETAKANDADHRRPVQSRRGRSRSHARHRGRRASLQRRVDGAALSRLRADPGRPAGRSTRWPSRRASAASARSRNRWRPPRRCATRMASRPRPMACSRPISPMRRRTSADHLTHFYIFFMPDFARDAYAGQAWHRRPRRARFKAIAGSGGARRPAGAARGFSQIMGIIAGKWPHSLALQPGGTTRRHRSRASRCGCVAIAARFRRFLEARVFAAPLEDVLGDRRPPSELDRLARRGAAAISPPFLRLARVLELDQSRHAAGSVDELWRLSRRRRRAVSDAACSTRAARGRTACRSTRSARTCRTPGCATAPAEPALSAHRFPMPISRRLLLVQGAAASGPAGRGRRARAAGGRGPAADARPA